MIEAAPASTVRQVWRVSALLLAAADSLAARFGACAVQGEISGFSRSGSGHCYFSLKDAGKTDALLRCCLFRRAGALVDFQPSDGQLVEVRGRLGVYGPRGELQLVVESMQRAGTGALYEQFLRLRDRLQGEGVFEAAAKRQLPLYPRRLGVITSPAGAALHDVLTALARRAPHVEVIVYPSAVQGAEAPGALCSALAIASQRAEVDALILCRGGGSLEDLWAFNDERVVRAVRASMLPVVCGVGHETDVSLCDLAADLRAPTPTAAAELAAASRAACLDALEGRASALRRRSVQWLEREAQRLDRAALRLARPSEATRRRSQDLALLEQRFRGASIRLAERRRVADAQRAARLQRATAAAFARERARLEGAAGRLDGVDPRRVLARGYALLTDGEGHAVTSAAGVVPGQTLEAQLGDGALDLAVVAARLAR